ncbi:hypothetical protein BH24ACT3_BH24ACT3_09780 [soil metagenome]
MTPGSAKPELLSEAKPLKATQLAEAAQSDIAHDSFSPRHSYWRRGFLARVAVVGSALSVAPLDFVLRPGTAYAQVCGPGASCSSGWTAFCCTVNQGRNSCPPGSFVAGWWKADNAGFCCGAARYILDCNATCPTQCRCRCASGTCDQRKVCCNQFRYGQCNQQISCFGPVVCRVATCTPPWQYDRACTTASATDNRTVNHGAPCLPNNCLSPIGKKYQAMGGPAGVLGSVVRNEGPTPDGSGRYAVYQFGAIYSSSRSGTHEVHGAIWARYRGLGAERSGLGFPRTDEQSTPERIFYSHFENGRIYHTFGTGSHPVQGAIWQAFHRLGGARGPLGLPLSHEQRAGDFVLYTIFQNGRIYHSLATGSHGVYGEMWKTFHALGGSRGPLGLPVTDPQVISTGVYWAGYQFGRIYESRTTGAQGVYGGYWSEYRRLGGSRGPLGLPRAGVAPVAGGASQPFTIGALYASETTGTHGLYGPIWRRYLDERGPGGRFGFPRSPIETDGAIERCRFEGGTLVHDTRTGVVTEEG